MSAGIFHGDCILGRYWMAPFANLTLYAESAPKSAPNIYDAGHWLKMAGIYTRTDATEMIEFEAFGNFSHIKAISYTVRQLAPIWIPDSAVSRPFNLTDPKPASRVRLRHIFFFESFCERAILHWTRSKCITPTANPSPCDSIHEMNASKSSLQ